jgi:dihydroxyacid dehydratase/phosphogluconate dehydratase
MHSNPSVRLATTSPSHSQANIPFSGAFAVGKISDEERRDVVLHACPGQGACGGMYTANTMSSALEVLGMTLPYSSGIPAVYPG